MRNIVRNNSVHTDETVQRQKKCQRVVSNVLYHVGHEAAEGNGDVHSQQDTSPVEYLQGINAAISYELKTERD